MDIEALISILAIDKGDLKILLFKKTTEPYKGYWILPGGKVDKAQSLEDFVTNIAIEKVGLPNLWLEQSFTFGGLDRNYENRTFSISYLGLTDPVNINVKMEENDIEKEWFKITELPKLAYDYENVINKNISSLKNKITNSNILKLLFPSDFTLPEIQRLYEQIFNINIDRRNFRKKFINLDLIEETGEFTEGNTGRPAKLYRFKDNIKEQNLF